MRVPKRKSEERAWKKSGPVFITPKGLEKIKEEINELEAKLPEMIAEVEHTKSHGDFSENAAYQHAKYTLRKTQGRIRRLSNKVKQAILIEKQDSDTIQLGSHVVLEANGKEFSFEILGAHEADPAKGRISNLSPLGKILLGKKAGEKVTLTLPENKVIYTVKKVS